MRKLIVLKEILSKMQGGSYMLCLLYLFTSCDVPKNNHQKIEVTTNPKRTEKRNIRPIIKDSSIVFFKKTTNEDIFLELKLGKYKQNEDLDSVYYVLDLKNLAPKDTLLVALFVWKVWKPRKLNAYYHSNEDIITNLVMFQQGTSQDYMYRSNRIASALDSMLFVNSEYTPLLLPNSSIRTFITIEKTLANYLEEYDAIEVRLHWAFLRYIEHLKSSTDKIEFAPKNKEIFIEIPTLKSTRHGSIDYRGISKFQTDTLNKPNSVFIPAKDIHKYMLWQCSYAVFDSSY